MKTKFVTKEEGEKNRRWQIVDAANKPLGRLASEIAVLLMGKHKPSYTPHVDDGDFVVVVNAEKITLSGNKAQDKIYYSHSGYIGGLKQISAGDLLAKHPERVIWKAVKNMLPKNRLAARMIKKLKVYIGPEHPHAAQMPETYQTKYI